MVEVTGRFAVIRPLKRLSESMKGIGREARRKLGGMSATELLEKMRREDREEL
mgnify:CR=1 FL=1